MKKTNQLTIMVAIEKETFTPKFSLDAIRSAAQQGKFQYAGRKVDRDIRNLGYTGDDVCRCISHLTSGQFKKCIHYKNSSIYDVYISDYQRHDEAVIDSIYMKLRLLENGELLVGVGSFHLA